MVRPGDKSWATENASFQKATLEDRADIEAERQ